jgi:hypothetical protein
MRRITLSGVLILGSPTTLSCSGTSCWRTATSAVRHADGRKCGAASNRVFADSEAFVACMCTRGWVLDHVVSDTPPVEDSIAFENIWARTQRSHPRRRHLAGRHQPLRSVGVRESFRRNLQAMHAGPWRFYSYSPPAPQPDTNDETNALRPMAESPEICALRATLDLNREHRRLPLLR